MGAFYPKAGMAQGLQRLSHAHRVVVCGRWSSDCIREEERAMASVLDDPELFPILPWDPQHGWEGDVQRRQGLESIAECGFTMAGFVQARDLPLCRRLGLGAIYLDETNPRVRAAQWSAMDDDAIDATVRRWVEATADSRALYGYYLGDEPGANDFSGLGRAVDAVKRHAPDKLAYINLFPDYATIGTRQLAKDLSQLQTDSYGEYFERFVSEVRPQFISWDNYMVQYSQDLRNIEPATSYYRNLLQVRDVASRHGLPFWQIVSSNQIRPTTTIPSPANLLLQAYTTLAAGGHSVGWYTYYARGYGYAPIDADEQRTPTWYHLAEVNRQIRSLGPVLNRLTSREVRFSGGGPVPGLPGLPGEIIRGVECSEPLMLGSFCDDVGGDYVMVVNTSLERSAKFRLELGPERAVESRYCPAAGAFRPVAPDEARWLVAGEGVLLRVR